MSDGAPFRHPGWKAEGGLVRQGDLGGDAGREKAFWILALLIDRRGQLRRLIGSGLVYPWAAAAPFPHHTRGFSPPS